MFQIIRETGVSTPINQTVNQLHIFVTLYARELGRGLHSLRDKQRMNNIYYIDTDEIPGFLLLLKNNILTARSEDTIFIFHV